eukprot:GHVQ01021404.1.p1 GENE.GHVQ01021404.1~~GHVQ01021404.1.p1  ORF type:complete len:957 (+),score=135.13 GHVQ01021404.1:1311-4181(+)
MTVSFLEIYLDQIRDLGAAYLPQHQGCNGSSPLSQQPRHPQTFVDNGMTPAHDGDGRDIQRIMRAGGDAVQGAESLRSSPYQMYDNWFNTIAEANRNVALSSRSSLPSSSSLTTLGTSSSSGSNIVLDERSWPIEVGGNITSRSSVMGSSRGSSKRQKAFTGDSGASQDNNSCHSSGHRSTGESGSNREQRPHSRCEKDDTTPWTRGHSLREPPGLEIHETSDGQVFVRDLETIPVSSMAEVLDILNAGVRYRATFETKLNSVSSRSHTVFSITLLQKPKNGMEESVQSCINFVDLAGSERIARSKSRGRRFQEAVMINSSLSALGKVVLTVSEDSRAGRNSKHIPYRNSKLTRILQNSIGGNSFVTLLACIHPVDVNYEESLNSLAFADRCKSLTNAPTVNYYDEHLSDKQKMEEVQEEIDRLRWGLEAVTQGDACGSHEKSDCIGESKASLSEAAREPFSCSSSALFSGSSRPSRSSLSNLSEASAQQETAFENDSTTKENYYKKRVKGTCATLLQDIVSFPPVREAVCDRGQSVEVGQSNETLRRHDVVMFYKLLLESENAQKAIVCHRDLLEARLNQDIARVESGEMKLNKQDQYKRQLQEMQNKTDDRLTSKLASLQRDEESLTISLGNAKTALAGDAELVAEWFRHYSKTVPDAQRQASELLTEETNKLVDLDSRLLELERQNDEKSRQKQDDQALRDAERAAQHRQASIERDKELEKLREYYEGQLRAQTKELENYQTKLKTNSAAYEADINKKENDTLKLFNICQRLLLTIRECEEGGSYPLTIQNGRRCFVIPQSCHPALPPTPLSHPILDEDKGYVTQEENQIQQQTMKGQSSSKLSAVGGCVQREQNPNSLLLFAAEALTLLAAESTSEVARDELAEGPGQAAVHVPHLQTASERKSHLRRQLEDTRRNVMALRRSLEAVKGPPQLHQQCGKVKFLTRGNRDSMA